MQRLSLVARRPFLIGVAIFAALVLGVLTYGLSYANRFMPRTSIATVALAGLHKDEAVAALTKYTDNFLDSKLTFTYQPSDGGEVKAWDLDPRSLGTTIAVNEAIESLWQKQKAGSWGQRFLRLLSAPFSAKTGDITINPVSASGEKVLIEQVLGSIEKPYKETSISFAPGNVTVIPGVTGRKLHRSKFEEQLFAIYKRGSGVVNLETVVSQPEVTAAQAESARVLAQSILQDDWKVQGGEKTLDLPRKTLATLLASEVARDGNGRATGLSLVVQSDLLAPVLQEWSERINKKPINARLALVDGVVKVDQPGTAGDAMNLQASQARLQSMLLSYGGGSRTVPLVVDVSPPAVRTETLSSLGLVAKIGSATTDFSGSPTNRKFNIAVGQRSLDRQLVLPGANFSTVGTLGPISEATGYLPELVIVNNRTIPEAGGGLCQVSTTLFRSVMNAGLPIVERSNHAYRVSYYEREVGPGLDATIYEPKPDFIWKNDMTTAVYVQSFIKGDKITFELYGTTDGRVASVGKPVILKEFPAGDPIYVDTDTLFVGEKKQIERSHAGASTSVSYVVTKDGKNLINQTFKSYYKPWPEQWLVGTKLRPGEPTPSPTPTPTP